MPNLTVFIGKEERIFSFSGTPSIREALTGAGIFHSHPCGGRGVCGKCSVRITGILSEPSGRERIPGYRLSCVTRLLGDATVWLPEEKTVQAEGTMPSAPSGNETGTGRETASLTGVFDIGTTTVVLRLADDQGHPVAGAGRLNPQREIAADVIGRIAAAKAEGFCQREMILRCMEELIREALGQAPDRIRESGIRHWIVTGNTAMLYLLTGTDPDELGHAPFTVTRRFDEMTELPMGKAYLPPCIGAFAGADLACAVLASGMTDHPEPALLCDAGTNGEIALWDGKTLWTASVAVGPAFEGVGIREGCMNVPGAICRVRLVNGSYFAETLDGKPAVGLCGSGVLDAIARGLERGDIDPDGYLESPIVLREGISLYPEDVRAVQLAKAAVAAGILRLTEVSGIEPERIGAWYLCGGFGSHLDPASAITAGLLPSAAAGRISVLGNAALTGACRLTEETEKEKLRRIVSSAQQVTLGGDPAFNSAYIEQMAFPDRSGEAFREERE